MTVQVSFGSEGGSGTPVPDLSIEVDDIQAALERFKEANISIEYGPVSEPGVYEDSTVATLSESSSTSYNMSECRQQGAAADARAAELGR